MAQSVKRLKSLINLRSPTFFRGWVVHLKHYLNYFYKMNIKKLLRENLNEISVNSIKQELQNIIDSYYGEINGKILTPDELKKLKQDIKNNYLSKSDEIFNTKKDDIRQKVFNYHHPIGQIIINGVELRIAEGLIKNRQKTYLLYANGDIIGEFYSVNDIEKIVKDINQNINETLIGQNNNLIDLTQSDINEILKGYIECALWTEEDRLKDDITYDPDDEEYEDMSEIQKLTILNGKFATKSFKAFLSDDIDVDSKIDAYKDIKTFIKTAGDVAVNEAINENGLFKLGMDIWFTRNGHGAGFFDHNYDNEDILINAGKKLKPVELYIGDDNKLYFQ
jgi:hypothetical protein